MYQEVVAGVAIQLQDAGKVICPISTACLSVG